MAPRLMRLPLVRVSSMPVTAMSMLKGMASAAITAARRFPKRRKRTAMTNAAPSKRLFATVWSVALTR